MKSFFENWRAVFLALLLLLLTSQPLTLFKKLPLFLIGFIYLIVFERENT